MMTYAYYSACTFSTDVQCVSTKVILLFAYGPFACENL